VSKEYLEYWGFKKDPFYLAPDSEMIYLGGQYYECFERLLYAVNTNTGGTLLVSEEPGLGKTTMLLKLVAEMEWACGKNFRCAFIDHPTLTVAQLMSQISSSLALAEPQGDKFVNLTKMREELTQLKKAGGKALVIIDEAHMLGQRPDVLQDLRMLLNLTYEREYLFTMILSGQKPLWDTMKAIPEFWQRLPVKYYLVPLRLKETTDLIAHRITRAGYEKDGEIFTTEALEMIQRFARGLPRTVVALCNICLLIGAAYRAKRIGFKEVSKAVHVMSGRGEDENLSYAAAKEEAEKKRGDQSLFWRIMNRIKR
jgi:type II secretory pathway predicted ATPase ExeA